MNSSTFVLVAAIVLWLSPAAAEDCSPVKTAMIRASKTPHTATVTREKNGKPVTNRMIQTNDNKYIESDGKWHSLGTLLDDMGSIEDRLKTAKITCARLGPEQVGGQTATVYTARLENEETVSDNKLWLRSDGLPLKVDHTIEGRASSTVFDYDHAEAPAVSTPLEVK